MFILVAQVPMWGCWIAVCVCLIIGAAVGVAAAYYTAIGVSIMALFVGFVTGVLMYHSWVYILAEANPQLGLWVSCMVCMVVCVGLSIGFREHAMILGSATCGSYLCVRAVATFVGGFVNEFLIGQDIIDHAFWRLRWPFYVYFAVWIALSIFAACLQTSLRRAYLGHGYGGFKYRKI